MASEGGLSLVGAILLKLLVHEQKFYLPKEEGGGGSDSAVAHVAQRKGNEETSHGKDESRGKGLKCYNCEGSGSFELRCVTPTRECLMTPKNVMYVSRVAANLISVSKASKVACVLFKKNGKCELEVDGEVVLVARKVKGIYVVDRAVNAPSAKVVQMGALSEMEQKGAAPKEDKVLRESDERIMISRDVIFDKGEGNNGVVELSSGPTEGFLEEAQRRATALCRRPHTHASATERGRVACTIFKTDQSGQVSETVQKTTTEPREIADDIGMPTPASQRYSVRERHAPRGWYCANFAVDTKAGEHPKETEEQPATVIKKP
ncbi:hypothetical protein KFL_012550030 [Klebsormidium nitens]|uniref:Uncharacterized protein n=1 Tax=Klebsormidium nitens TaxID=105231 RepID=A0A1Y1IUI5_KLENI|nr:hypothetical protein KFL_012550030 [Klebsormidium nitens]|eukprot:GAQ93021.1 hypothetical protein KFL_012550030 [Klebsormidium nitens]